MDISYTSLLTISDELVEMATKALKAAESIRLHIAAEKERAVKATLGGPPPSRAPRKPK